MLAVVVALSWSAMVSPARAADDGRLVLVASVNSPIATLSPGDVRRLYLGIPITYAGREIAALINAETPTVKEMFLQHVLFMSAQAYERQLSARLYRAGGNRIPEFTDLRPLLDSLASDPLAVTYMQSETAARHPRIKILGEL
jgi:hypothetical protein